MKKRKGKWKPRGRQLGKPFYSKYRSSNNKKICEDNEKKRLEIEKSITESLIKKYEEEEEKQMKKE